LVTLFVESTFPEERFRDALEPRVQMAARRIEFVVAMDLDCFQVAIELRGEGGRSLTDGAR
jgi:hypothetical protein